MPNIGGYDAYDAGTEEPPIKNAETQTAVEAGPELYDASVQTAVVSSKVAITQTQTVTYNEEDTQTETVI